MKQPAKRPPGRPKGATPPKIRIQVPIDVDTAEQIKAHAEATGLTVAEVARNAIDKGLPRVLKSKP